VKIVFKIFLPNHTALCGNCWRIAGAKDVSCPHCYAMFSLNGNYHLGDWLTGRPTTAEIKDEATE
jgi:hypothetical protein